MVGVKFFLDTNALILVDGLEGSDLQDFKGRIEGSSSELSVTHIQVDEKHPKELKNYQLKIKKVLERLTNKGIAVQVKTTKMGVWGVKRWGYFRWSDEETGKLYDELCKEIDECMKWKANLKWLSKTKEEKILNIARDATIAISSLGHDFFITCDKCLSESWKNVISKHSMLTQRYKLPRVIYTRPSPKTVAKQMLKLLP